MNRIKLPPPHPNAVVRLWGRFLCKFVGHKYMVLRSLSKDARKVGCPRCQQMWGMHDRTKSFVKWDSDLEALHSDHGVLDLSIDPRWYPDD